MVATVSVDHEMLMPEEVTPQDARYCSTGPLPDDAGDEDVAAAAWGDAVPLLAGPVVKL